MNYLRLTTAAILFFVFSASTRAEDPVQNKILRVGAVLSLSGDAAMSGDAIRKGIELAQEELESHGWQVDIAWEDGQTKPTKVISSFQFLAGRGYNLFLGPTWSFEINSVKPVLEQLNAVTIAPAGSTDINGGPSKAIFNLCPLRSKQIEVLSEWLKKKNFKKAYIIVPSGDWGIVHQKVFTQALKLAGVPLEGSDDYEYGLSKSALNSLLMKRKASGVDLILVTGAGGDIDNMLNIRHELRWNAAFLSTEDLWDSIDMGLISPSAPELHDAWVLGLPLIGSFFQHFEDKYREIPKTYSDRGYDSLMLLAKAVEAVGPGSEAVRNYLLNQKGFQGVTGNIQFNADGDRTSGEYRVMEAFDNKKRS